MSLPKGYKHSAETRLKMSRLAMGNKSALGKNVGKKHSEETKRKMSDAHTGSKAYNWKEDKPKCIECGHMLAQRISLYCRVCVFKGERASNWQGGKTLLGKVIRNSAEYRNWRNLVFERDSYTCQHCKKRGIKLNADHIKPFSLFPELRFELSNGRTLCIECHQKTDTYGAKILCKTQP